MKNSLKTMLFTLALSCAAFGSPAVSGVAPSHSALPTIPNEIAENSSLFLFFFWGYLDAEDIIDSVRETPRLSFKDMAAVARILADHFSEFGAPAKSYMLGQAYAFDREAERRGEY